jgi:hypothetical protein
MQDGADETEHLPRVSSLGVMPPSEALVERETESPNGLLAVGSMVG